MFSSFIIWKNKAFPKHDLNPHWQKQVSLCMPCLINYTFFAKFESLAEESERLLEYFQRNSDPSAAKLRFPKISSKYLTEEKIRETWKLVPEEKVEIIRQVYKDDFLFYGYNPYLYRGFT